MLTCKAHQKLQIQRWYIYYKVGMCFIFFQCLAPKSQRLKNSIWRQAPQEDYFFAPIRCCLWFLILVALALYLPERLFPPSQFSIWFLYINVTLRNWWEKWLSHFFLIGLILQCPKKFIVVNMFLLVSSTKTRILTHWFRRFLMENLAGK